MEKFNKAVKKRCLLNKRYLSKILKYSNPRYFSNFMKMNRRIYKRSMFVYDVSIEKTLLNNNFLKKVKSTSLHLPNNSKYNLLISNNEEEEKLRLAGKYNVSDLSPNGFYNHSAIINIRDKVNYLSDIESVLSYTSDSSEKDDKTNEENERNMSKKELYDNYLTEDFENVNKYELVPEMSTYFIDFSKIFMYRHFKKYSHLVNWVAIARECNLTTNAMIYFRKKLELALLLRHQKIEPEFVDYIINNKNKYKNLKKDNLNFQPQPPNLVSLAGANNNNIINQAVTNIFGNNTNIDINNYKTEDENMREKLKESDLFNYLVIHIKNIDKKNYGKIFGKYKNLINYDEFSNLIEINNEELLDLLKDKINWTKFLHYYYNIYKTNSLCVDGYLNKEFLLKKYINKYKEYLNVKKGTLLWANITYHKSEHKYKIFMKDYENGKYDYLSIGYVVALMGSVYFLYKYKIIKKPIFYVLIVLLGMMLVYNINNYIRRRTKDKDKIKNIM